LQRVLGCGRIQIERLKEMLINTLVLVVTLAQVGTLTREESGEVKNSAAFLYRDLYATIALSNPVQQRIILSGMLCEAKQRKVDVEESLRRGLTKPLVRASLIADKDIKNAEVKFIGMDFSPLSCGNREVERLVECLAPAPPLWCELNPDVSVQVAAAEVIVNGNKSVAKIDPIFPTIPTINNRVDVDPWDPPSAQRIFRLW